MKKFIYLKNGRSKYFNLKNKGIIVICILVVSFLSSSIADIQAPPASEFGKTRKLARGLANVLYGWSEIPKRLEYNTTYDGGAREFSLGIIDGVRRTAVRFGYGIYEIFTFACPSCNNGYKQPYKSLFYDVTNGYTEFPPELGFISNSDYTRTINY